MSLLRLARLVGAALAASALLVTAGPAVAAPPAAPTGLTAVHDPAQGVALAWNDNATDETAYRIERCDIAVCRFEPVLQVGPNRSSATDTTASVGTTYAYRVFAIRNEIVQIVASDYSNEAGVSTGSSGLAPVSALRLSPRSTSVALSWKNRARAAVEIWRSGGGGDWAVVALLDPGAARFTDSGLSTRTTYTYALRTVQGNAVSPFVILSATTRR